MFIYDPFIYEKASKLEISTRLSVS